MFNYIFSYELFTASQESKNDLVVIYLHVVRFPKPVWNGANPKRHYGHPDVVTGKALEKLKIGLNRLKLKATTVKPFLLKIVVTQSKSY